MALVSNRLSDTLTEKARSKLGIRFGRFTVAAIAAFATTEVVLTICAGPLLLTATWASLISWFSGALTLAPPGAVGHPGEAQPVEEVVHPRDVQLVQGVLALLALTHPPPVDGRGHLGHLVAVGDDADQQLGRLVLRLGELDGPGDLGSHGPQPERRVADA